MGIFSLIKPLKKYEEYVYRANTYESLFLRNKAIQVMNMAIQQQFSNEEKSSGLIYLGILYTNSKEYEKASDSYNQGLEMMKNENFSYSNNFKKAIETFIKNEDKERAEYWLNNLIDRQRYDRKFKKLVMFKTEIQ
jgi:lipoprotein NlpI